MSNSEETLYDDRERLRVTLASIGDAVITTDMHGRITFLNPVAQSLTGWGPDEASGISLETVFKIVNEDTRREVENPATRALREGLVVGLANHTLLIAKDGTERPIDDSAAPIRNQKGDVAGVVLVFRDVTERRNAERTLQESEERFRLLVEGVQDYAIFSLDPEGTITSWNSGAEKIKGYKSQEVIGQHISIFYTPDEIAAGDPQTVLSAASATGHFVGEGWRVRKDGSTFWASVVVTALRDEAGQLKGFAKITRDLTERKWGEEELRSREERIRAITQSANDAIIAADESGQIISWNKAATAIFGYSEAEVLSQSLTMLMPDRYQELHRNGLARQHSTGESRVIGRTVELEGRHKDGSEFPVELSLATWHSAQGQFYTGILRDITERKHKDQALRQMERIRAQADILTESNRRKDEFLAMLSHELRNPLAPILNAVHLLRLESHDNANLQHATAIIDRQAAHLTRLVDDLLEVSRISTGRIRLKQEILDLRSIAERAVEVVRPMIMQRRHDLALSLGSAPLWLHADATRLEQVIVNLLANAAKYTHDGGQIRLSIGQEGNEAVLRVADSGVGIASELLPVVFDLFTQAERSLDRSQGGLGIGLTIVQRVVEMHGGKVEAVSAGIGHGSEFIVRLPLASSPVGTLHRPSEEEPKPSAVCKRVLVVDDNKDSADTLAILLRRAGHDVRACYAGQEALQLATTFHPDAILLDIGLPEIDGYEVARRLRQDPQFASIRLIAITGYGQEADQQRSFEAGFNEHLVKPIDPQRIYEALSAPSRPDI
jgi:PAS domain S-box-containing protein